MTRRLRHRKMRPEEVADGQRYTWHKHEWHVRHVTRFRDAEGNVIAGWVILCRIYDRKHKTVNLISFAARARR
jgi:hypothetical protein